MFLKYDNISFSLHLIHGDYNEIKVKQYVLKYRFYLPGKSALRLFKNA